jgi:hypothetical protein
MAMVPEKPGAVVVVGAGTVVVVATVVGGAVVVVVVVVVAATEVVVLAAEVVAARFDGEEHATNASRSTAPVERRTRGGTTASYATEENGAGERAAPRLG